MLTIPSFVMARGGRKIAIDVVAIERRAAELDRVDCENWRRYWRGLSAKRRAAITRATPGWADLKRIAEIYDQAAMLTARTGVEHHVDHFYPVQGRFVSGLHVQGNLQILTATANLKKGNKLIHEQEASKCLHQ